MYDIAIIGSGPAGVAAALNAQIRRCSLVIFGAQAESEKLKRAEKIPNYPGLPQISGAELAAAFGAHLEKAGIRPEKKNIDHVYPMGDYYALTCADEMWEARAVILATGVSAQNMLKGEEALVGRGVSYCATCDGMLYKGKTVIVLAYDAQAKEEADYLKTIAQKVIYVPLSKQAGEPEGVEIVAGIQPLELCRDDGAVSVVARGETLRGDCVFIFRGAIAPGILVPGLETEDGFVKVNRDLSTNLPGVFAAGDVTGLPHQIAKAVGEGATAGLSAGKYVSAWKNP